MRRSEFQFVGALGLPRPLPDAAGPDSGLDLYLQAPEQDEIEVVSELRSIGSDRSSAFCRARPRATEARREAALCVAEAALLGLDAAETPYLRRAIAAYLWQTLGGASNAHALGRDAPEESASSNVRWMWQSGNPPSGQEA